MVIRKGRWVNVHSGEIIPGTDIAITAGRFAYVGPDASHAIGPNTQSSRRKAASSCPACATATCMWKAAW